MDFLRENRFKVNPSITYFHEFDDVMEQLAAIQENRGQLDYLIDGAVIKITDMRTREVLGYTDKFAGRWHTNSRQKRPRRFLTLWYGMWVVLEK